MDLFEQADNSLRNHLPRDGIVNYYGKIFSDREADDYLERLLNDISWQHDEAFIHGKHIITKRKVAWYADQPFTYHYSNTQRIASPWLPILVELKHKLEQQCGETFNACLLNLYQSGEEGMSWHSDAEKELKKEAAIASLSFGANRKFCFKHRASKENISIYLEHGSLLIMKGKVQQNWLHSLPKTKQANCPRVNLTFRTMLEQ